MGPTKKGSRFRIFGDDTKELSGTQYKVGHGALNDRNVEAFNIWHFAAGMDKIFILEKNFGLISLTPSIKILQLGPQ